jgi:TonB family protein
MSIVVALASLVLGQTGCTQAVLQRDAAELCAAAALFRQAESQPAPERRRTYEDAAEHASRAASLATTSDAKADATEFLASIYDEHHLNQPDREQGALLDVIALRPNDLKPVDRLARLLERMGLAEAAEDTLLAAHRRQLNEIEPLRLLAQFYARRVTALHRAAEPPKADNALAIPQPDDKGVYRVGGPIAAPTRLDRVQYPQEARDAGIQGVVILEVVIDERGRVGDAKVMRSIPLLDQPAMDEVSRWQFTPTVVNGQPVKVRMMVTQNFTLK